MGDLGMHVVHIPLRLGWKPVNMYAQLQNIYHERPDGKGGFDVCDTWDNALMDTEVVIDDQVVPMKLETKRMPPGETNTWYIKILGTEGGARYSTKGPKTFWTFNREKEQVWQKTDLGFKTDFPTITGGIFEPAFPDCFMQMLAALFAERANNLQGRFGCVTPDEAVASHEIFEAAIDSHRHKKVIEVGKKYQHQNL